ncbi:MAG: hypothetical protein R3B96_22855 [Pirellulaceae bacterium]
MIGGLPIIERAVRESKVDTPFHGLAVNSLAMPRANRQDRALA